MVAIAKALTYASRILVMDEPTAALTAAEVERLFKVMREIAERGVGIVYISHRLEEVPRVADASPCCATGGRVGDEPADAPQARLVRLLVGRPLTRCFRRRAANIGAGLLRLEQRGFRAETPNAPAGRRRATSR